MNNFTIIFIIVFIGLVAIWFNNSETEKSIKEILKKYSYVGVSKSMNYTITQYCIHSVTFVVLIGFLLKYTFDNFLYSCFIVGIGLFFIPYFQLLSYRQKAYINYQELIFVYVETSLLYLRENKTSLQLLIDCKEALGSPLQEDLSLVIDYIEKTGDYAGGLDAFAEKYNHSAIHHVHVLLKAKRQEGCIDEQLVDYLLANMEEFEFIMHDYWLKKKAHRSMFYVMIALDCLAVVMISQFLVGQSLGTVNHRVFDNIILIFYLLNGATIILYEVLTNKDKEIQ